MTPFISGFLAGVVVGVVLTLVAFYIVSGERYGKD